MAHRKECKGCGRALGLRGQVECPCWTAVNGGATIPSGLKALRKRVFAARKAAALAVNDEQYRAARAVVNVVNAAGR